MQRNRVAALAILGFAILLGSGCEGRTHDTDSTTRAQVAVPPCPKGVPPWRVTGKCILQDK